MTKTALVTTTINVPTVLRLYRAYGPDVAFFVAGDLKTDLGCAELCVSIGNVRYLSPEIQSSLGYKCSELLGWNCIARRNIATLEALKQGADIIVMVDDDNIPMNEFYFADHIMALTTLHSGVKVNGRLGWFDVGQLLDPIAGHRGFPISPKLTEWRANPVVDVSVGVNAGICMGDPDISAYFRIANHPTVHRTSQLLDNGVVVDPRTRTVFNSQNTSFIRELAPAMFMMPGIGRMDDIWASLICQRVMRDRGLHVKFGRPYVFQERNQHDLVSDLKAEMHGMEHTVGFAQYLDRFSSFAGMSIIDAVRSIYKGDETFLPTKSVMAALAFLDDCKKVMG